jgi:hypothetical protein
MGLYSYVVDIFGELVGGLLVLAFFTCEIEYLDRVTVERSLVFIDYRIMTVDSYDAVVVRD